ncbi:MAG: glycosyltransferase [Candidatus Micrarchaeota archaeon]|nr:glycosyltransferase [Candidatus Micrarchaeota archaeon]
MFRNYDVQLTGRLLTVTLFTILSIAGIAFSIYLFLISRTLYMYALSSAFTALSLFAGFFNIYASIWYYRSYLYDKYLKGINAWLKPLSRFPTIAVAIPVYNEEPEMVERNLKSLMKLNYPKAKLHFYMLDDSTDTTIAGSLSAVAKKFKIAYIHRNDRKGYKAGALNNLMKVCKEEYLAIFDSDEYLTNRNFLIDTLPYFQNAKISYIQTEKRYARGTFFSDAVDIFDAFFFKFIQPARALNNTAVFAGSCGVIRTSALEKIGGFPEYVIEDTFFSFESDMHGFESLYVPKVYALGRPIMTFTELVKQQWRYNYGDTQFIRYFLSRPGPKKPRDPFGNIDYWTHGLGLNYISIVLIIFTLISIGMVFSSIPFEHLNVLNPFAQTSNLNLSLEFLGFFAFLLSLLTPVILTKIYFKSLTKGLMVFLLNYALAFVRTKAAIATFVSSKNPGIHWNRLKIQQQSGSRNIVSSILNTKAEILFSMSMFGLAIFALSESNLAGGFWLAWYGILYMSATAFLLKYG